MREGSQSGRDKYRVTPCATFRKQNKQREKETNQETDAEPSGTQCWPPAGKWLGDGGTRRRGDGVTGPGGVRRC